MAELDSNQFQDFEEYFSEKPRAIDMMRTGAMVALIFYCRVSLT